MYLDFLLTKISRSVETFTKIHRSKNYNIHSHHKTETFTKSERDSLKLKKIVQKYYTLGSSMIAPT